MAGPHGNGAKTKGSTRTTVAEPLVTTPGGGGIKIWEDDPISGLPLISTEIPDLSKRPLSLSIVTNGAPPPAKPYPLGSTGFRYWNAAATLRRGADYWGGVQPGITWEPGEPLKVHLDAGVDLNAFYDRQGLSFFHATSGNQVVYSGESPDVLCHELGHAVLDAARPQLWDAMSIEIPAFHESFGDISAILSALQLPQVRVAVLTETSGVLSHSSRLSRLAEQLGAAIRLLQPDAVEPDCLRNAVNSWLYHDPATLPSDGPVTVLSTEPHSFSRVFTGGFFQAIAGMLAVEANPPTESALEQVSQNAGRLLLRAAANAPVATHYYSQIAAQLLQADADLFAGKYHDAIQSAFVQRGILSLEAAAGLSTGNLSAAPRRTAAAGAGRPALGTVVLSGKDFGLDDKPLRVTGATESPQVGVTAGAVGVGAIQQPTAEEAARLYVTSLFRHGRVEMGMGVAALPVTHPSTHKTHVLEVQDGGYTLHRLRFYCRPR